MEMNKLVLKVSIIHKKKLYAAEDVKAFKYSNHEMSLSDIFSIYFSTVYMSSYIPRIKREIKKSLQPGLHHLVPSYNRILYALLLFIMYII